MKKKLLFAINVDWYFNLHWRERLLLNMTPGYWIHLCLSETTENNCWVDFQFQSLSLSRSSISILSNLKTLYDSLRIFWKVRPDAIHSVTVKPNIMFGLLALVFRKPILITIPGLGTIFSAFGKKAIFIQRFILAMYWLTAKNKRAFFIFENDSDLAFFKKKKISSELNSSVVPGAGVNVTRFRKEPFRWGNDGTLQILFGARLLKKKGLFELVNVVWDLIQDGYPVVLNVAGLIDRDSLDAIPISQIELWHQEGKINWLGQVDNIETVITNNHVIVLPTSYGEGMPRILLEANACGRPVIASNIPGCSDFVINEQNGILFELGNHEALKNAIIRFFDKNFCKLIGDNGRKLVEQYYTDSHVIECYRRIYNERLG